MRHPALRLAFVLAVASGVAGVLAIPYSMTGMGMPMPTGALAIATFISAFVEFALVVLLLAWCGLRLGAPLGLDAPYLRALFAGGARPSDHRFGTAAALGAAAGFATIAIMHLVSPLLPAAYVTAYAAHTPPRWMGALAAFNGGLVEEVAFRLFVLALVARVVAKLTKRPPIALAIGNVVAALAFGAAHLPQLDAIAADVPGGAPVLTVALTLAVNGGLGLLFGSLFRRRGLEHAMVAHFAADLALHVAFA